MNDRPTPTPTPADDSDGIGTYQDPNALDEEA